MDDRPSPHDPVQTAVARNIDEFSRLVRDSFMPLEVSSDALSFTGSIRVARRDDVYCYEVVAPAHVIERTPETISRTTTGEFYKISMMLAGSCMVLQDGREAFLGCGDLTLYDTTRPYTLVSDDGSRTAVVMIPRRLIDLPPGIVGELTAVRVAGNSGIGAIVSPLVASLAADLAQLATPAGARLAHNVVDLVTTMLVGELDIDTETTTQSALLRRACAHIDDNLGDPALSPTTIAAALYISTRYLQAMFQRQGTTVSGWVRERRLERCRRDLTDPLLAARPVAQIAARWGFLEPTHFSRAFKERYGCPPRDARATALADTAA